LTSDAIVAASRRRAGVGTIFRVFLIIGAISFGGGVVAHLRNRLVARERWMDDRRFVEILAISQTLPGLNATNMAILAGDALHGTLGALAALAGVCLPGMAMMYIVGMVYQIERERPLVEAGLEGVAAAAVGLILATTLQLGRKSLTLLDDLVFVLITILCINRLKLSMPLVLIGVGLLATVWYRATGRAASAHPR
jgi:chromate transporter